MTSHQPLEPPLIRESAFWVRSQGRWSMSNRGFRADSRISADDRIDVFTGADGNETVQLFAAQVEAVCGVDAFAEYEGYWLGLGSLWTADKVRIRRAVPASEPDCFALLWVDLDDSSPWEQIRELPGAVFHDPRSSNGLVSIMVRVSDLTDYREEVTDLSDGVLR